MYVVRVGHATGGRNIMSKRKDGRGVGRLRRDAVEGKGMTTEFYQKPVMKTESHLPSLVNKMEGLKIRNKNPKKYIALNF
jgi:hypothetical protein